MNSMKDDIENIITVLIDVLEENGMVFEKDDSSSVKGEVPCDNGEFTIPVSISNRHVHLCKDDLEACFGKGYELTPMKDLSQPGQYACSETLTLCGPRGAIEKVRILGPLRRKSQVELLAGDNFKLGTKAPLRLSGDLKGSEGLTIIGPKGSVQMQQGAIIAKRHIHMTNEDAAFYGVEDKQIVSLEIPGERGGVITNVVIRANDNSKLDCHIDVEEANGLGVTAGTKGRIVK